MEGRVIQVVLLTAIAAVIGGSLFVELYVAPRYRRWRVKRVHRHVRELLSTYRTLRAKFEAVHLAQAMADHEGDVGAPLRVLHSAGGRVAVLEVIGAAPCSPWEDN